MVMGELATSTEVLIIGAGPGGYVAAIRAAQLGKDVTLLDKAEVGGICLNHGCIPSKAVIHAADLAHQLTTASAMGIACKDSLNIKKLNAWKDAVVQKLVGGVRGLLEGNGVTLIQGSARFVSSNEVRVSGEQGGHTIHFEHCIIATGSSPVELKGFAYDGKNVWSSRRALEMTSVPKRLAIVGGGYIGLELGMAYQKVGSKITILQHGAHLMPVMPQDAVSLVQKRLESLGGTVILGARANSIKKGKGVTVNYEVDGKAKSLDADAVLVAVGRRPNTKDIGLEHTSVEVDEHGFIKVDEQMRTTAPHIYAIGDVAGQPMLAHKASRQAQVAAEAIAGKPTGFDNLVVPAVVFTDPEIAMVGLGVEAAKAKGYEVATGTFPLHALGRALTTNAPDGFVRLVCDKKTGLVLGGIIVGGEASVMISELTLAIEMGAVAEDLALTVHPHPTYGEAIQEAAADVIGQAIHILHKKVNVGVTSKTVNAQKSTSGLASATTRPTKKPLRKIKRSERKSTSRRRMKTSSVGSKKKTKKGKKKKQRKETKKRSGSKKKAKRSRR